MIGCVARKVEKGGLSFSASKEDPLLMLDVGIWPCSCVCDECKGSGIGGESEGEGEICDGAVAFSMRAQVR